MNSLTHEQMRTHVPIVAWLNIVGSIVLLGIALFLLVLLPGIGAMSGDRQAMGILAVVGFSVGIFMAVLALPGLLAGIGLLKRKNWGRVLAIVVSFLNLLNFPLGTLLGGYSLWVLFQEAAGTYFE
ncbi:MAG: hypothetical protein MUC34_00460 [Anaerolineae bacterium]|jgi:hypothetical protein|nr:hypothetical protein [Anaerolineae bacterium]